MEICIILCVLQSAAFSLKKRMAQSPPTPDPPPPPPPHFLREQGPSHLSRDQTSSPPPRESRRVAATLNINPMSCLPLKAAPASAASAPIKVATVKAILQQQQQRQQQRQQHQQQRQEQEEGQGSKLRRKQSTPETFGITVGASVAVKPDAVAKAAAAAKKYACGTDWVVS